MIMKEKEIEYDIKRRIERIIQLNGLIAKHNRAIEILRIKRNTIKGEIKILKSDRFIK